MRVGPPLILHSSLCTLHFLQMHPPPEVRAGSNSALTSGGGWGQAAGLFCGTRPPRGVENFRRGNPLPGRPLSEERRSSRFKLARLYVLRAGSTRSARAALLQAAALPFNNPRAAPARANIPSFRPEIRPRRAGAASTHTNADRAGGQRD